MLSTMTLLTIDKPPLTRCYCTVSITGCKVDSQEVSSSLKSQAQSTSLKRVCFSNNEMNIIAKTRMINVQSRKSTHYMLL